MCNSCKHRRTVDDTQAPGKCPVCGKKGFSIPRCAKCPLDDLDIARTRSSAGLLLDRLTHMEFVSNRCKVDWHDLSAEDVHGMRVLAEERERLISDQDPQNQH